MKKQKILFLLGCVLLGAAGVLAAPWGVISNYVNEDSTDKTGERFLLRKILAGQTLSVGLQQNEYTDKHYDKLSRLIALSYNNWFANAARHIEKAGREEEFADILPILRRGIHLQISDYGKDLQVVFMPLKQIQLLCGRASAGCYSLNESIPHIYLPSNTTLLNILSYGQQNKKNIITHEIGHSLGFSDQYFQARSINSDEIYGAAEERPTVMRHSRDLTCDDADGIINLIDLTLGTRRGGNNGWKTLCPKSQEYYIGGTSAGKGPYRITLSDDSTAVVLITYNQGRRVAREVYPFALPQGVVNWQETPGRTTAQKDKFGRPVLEYGPNGELIYSMYLYDRVERLAVQNGRALNFVSQLQYKRRQRAGTLKNYKEMFFGQKGTVCLIRTHSLTKRGYTSEYAEGIEKARIIRYIKRGYDRNGRLVNNLYEEPAAAHKAPKASLQSATGSAAMEQRLGQQVDKQIATAQQNQLVKQLDQWTQRTLQEFSRKTK